jgi:hypothetical protein
MPNGKHPLSQRCKARSKRSGQRCKRTAIGIDVCYWHGGAAKQVKAKAERTIALWEAEQNQPTTTIERRDPETILLDLLHDSDITISKIKSELAEGGVSGPLLAVWGEWLDRVSKLSRLILDSGIRERVDERVTRISRSQSEQLLAVITHILNDPRVVIEPGVDPSAIVLDAMARVDQAAVAA